MTTQRGLKLVDCYDEIIKLFANNQVTNEQYSYLVPYIPYINQIDNDYDAQDPSRENDVINAKRVDSKMQLIHEYLGH